MSFNKINTIKPLYDIFENNKKIKKINLNNNEITDEEKIKEKCERHFIEINLDNNNIIKKDFESIKNSMFGNFTSNFSPEKITGIRRICEEFKQLNKNSLANINMSVMLPDETNIHQWRCSFIGPEDTPYNGGLFDLLVLFSDDYPIKAPKIKFRTPIYHTNVNSTKSQFNEIGEICMYSTTFWKPEFKMKEVLINIFALFYFAFPNTPFNIDMVGEFISNRNLYEEKIRYFTNKYANPNVSYNNRFDNSCDKWDFTYNK